jgi:putative transposase
MMTVAGENLCLVADTSISGARVARELDTLVRLYGKPACIVSDNGTEFTSRAILEWAAKNEIEWHYIDPASPSRTGSSRASTALCAMNSSMRNCSTAWLTPAGSWPSGVTITTMSGLTHRWETGRLHKRVERVRAE